ncbi:hypothetical protein DXG01_000524 [Tephrocybe rancida]|nr:hypothetical protein DXG01_000524 [Tephrocybe rancida]
MAHLNLVAIRKREKTASRTQMMFAACLVSVILLTIYAIAILGFLATEIMKTLVNGNGTLIAANSTSDKKAFIFAQLVQWSTQTLALISDGVVVWRAWALYYDRPWVMFGPCMLLLATIGVNMSVSALQSQPTFSLHVDMIALATRLFDASLAMSLATNVITTLLALYKLWDHRRFFNRIGLRSQSRAEKIMVALIESGFVYCGVQIVYMILQSYHGKVLSPVDVATTVTFSFYISFTASYPSIVVVFVSQKRSMADTFGFSSASPPNTKSVRIDEERPATVGHLSFAHTTRSISEESGWDMPETRTPVQVVLGINGGREGRYIATATV